jgi:Uma2 family endonuclease
MSELRESDLWISPEDYLEGEKLAEVKHEYVEGRVFAMAGASADHGIIALNIGSELRAQLRGKRCQSFIADMKVRIPPTLPNCELTFYYPDVVVACEPEREPDEYVREFPAVVVEVLSPSNRATDLREKRAAYLRIDSLEHYLIVEQDRTEVTVYRRKGRNWEIMRWNQPEDVIYLGGIGCELTLAQIYEGVSWLVKTQ